MSGNSSNWKQKKELQQKIALKAAVTKIKEDCIQFSRGGVLDKSIIFFIPDSGESSTIGENAEDYEATGEKSPKEFQSEEF